MTSSEIVWVYGGGITCKSDAGLYFSGTYRNEVKFLSIYGSPQQVKGIFARFFGGGNPITVIRDTGEVIASLGIDFRDKYKLKTFPLGYGKRHGLIFTENLGAKTVLWTSPEEKEEKLLSALSKRRIPLAPEWLGELEKILVEDEQLIPLDGWGGFGGYECLLYDDKVCELIVEKIIPRFKRGIGGEYGIKNVCREVRQPTGRQDRREYELHL